MTIQEIIEGGKRQIQANLSFLAQEYKDKLKKKACLTCPASIQLMILELKHLYNMTNFRFKRDVARYKNKKGDKECVYNGNLTDQKALDFLRTNPERIRLFSKFPPNWEMLIHSDVSDPEKELEKMAIQAEMEAANDAKEMKEMLSEAKEEAGPDMADIEREATEAAEAAVREASGLNKEELSKKSLGELRKDHPEIKAATKADFIDRLME